MKKFFSTSLSLLTLVLLTSYTSTHKYDDKLFGCINKVIRLVEWENNRTQSNTFDIGFMGDQHLYTLTQNYFRGKTHQNKVIKVVHILNADQLEKTSPKVLYIGKHKGHNLDILNAICERKHIFSISDDQTYRNDIPLVLLQVHDNIVDILVNKTEAEKQSFKLSYHLLRAAKEVK
jgi:hypothetical protein